MTRFREFAQEALTLFQKALESEDVALQPELETLLAKYETPPSLIAKVDDERKMVYGWGSVSTENGQHITDHQGDVLTIDDLRPAVHKFMDEQRIGKTMHKGAKTHTVLDSIILDEPLQTALGIDLGREGWFAGVKVHHPETWQRVKSGELQGFSIGGSGIRTPL